MRRCPLSVVRGPLSSGVPGSATSAAACLLLFLLPGWRVWPATDHGPRATDNRPVFVLETVDGERLRGPLAQLREDWTVRLGPPSPRRRDGDAWLTLRRADRLLPPHPADSQILLTNGDCLPVAPASLKLAGERLSFRSPLLVKEEARLSLSAVAVVWLAAPDDTEDAEHFRRKLVAGNRRHDLVVMR